MFTVAKRILKVGYICNNCLGRQFAQLLTGTTNRDRGAAIRTALAMLYESKPFKTDLSNLYGYKFRTPVKHEKPKKCFLCGGLFENLEAFAEAAEQKSKGIDFKTFAVSTIIPDKIISNEERLWKSIGIKWCEPMKSELNREFGKLLSKKLGKEADETRPDVQFVLDPGKNTVGMAVNPVFIFGRYQKLARGIPQTKKSGYKESVEEIISKPLLKSTEGAGSIFHGLGREDIDARCLAWRPFVVEIARPKRRSVDSKKMAAAVKKSKKVKIKDLKTVTKKEVIKIKSAKLDKSYSVVAQFSGEPENLGRLNKLKGIISQQTPKRVLPRRADKVRRRLVKEISWKRLSGNRLELKIKAQSGLYIKELVTGDNGRTKPSVSEVLENQAVVKGLDVIKIWEPKNFI